MKDNRSVLKSNKDASGVKEGKWSPGLPTFSVVAPGKCQFTSEFTGVTLRGKDQISSDTFIFTFATPDYSKPLNLSTCACILAKFQPKDGDAVIRPYTPMSTNAMIGQFQLMVKIYPQGKMTQHLKKLMIGDKLDFKHIDFNVKIQYPFGKKMIGMIVGGSGITPMIQALHALLGNKDDATQVEMLYGSRTSENILGKETLDEWMKASKGQFNVTYVLSQEAEDSEWKGERGHITKELVEKSFGEPNENMMVFVCGPPPMYTSFCGPRDVKEVTGILADLGYSQEHVFKF